MYRHVDLDDLAKEAMCISTNLTDCLFALLWGRKYPEWKLAYGEVVWLKSKFGNSLRVDRRFLFLMEEVGCDIGFVEV